jgi:hypothetical protein
MGLMNCSDVPRNRETSFNCMYCSILLCRCRFYQLLLPGEWTFRNLHILLEYRPTGCIKSTLAIRSRRKPSALKFNVLIRSYKVHWKRNCDYRPKTTCRYVTLGVNSNGTITSKLIHRVKCNLYLARSPSLPMRDGGTHHQGTCIMISWALRPQYVSVMVQHIAGMATIRANMLTDISSRSKGMPSIFNCVHKSTEMMFIYHCLLCNKSYSTEDAESRAVYATRSALLLTNWNLITTTLVKIGNARGISLPLKYLVIVDEAEGTRWAWVDCSSRHA